MLESALIYLAAAIVAVPVAKRLGLGAVLGYLLAGILIGPFILGLVGDQKDVMHFAEFGVVMMLFLVGLELQPTRLWKLRHSILGLGGLQVLLTTGAIFSVSFFVLSLNWQASLAIGLMMALSSTAIALQSLKEKGWLEQEGGQNAFSVLLFQDIAVIPMLALLPLLAFMPATEQAEAHHNLIEHLPVWLQVAISVLTITAIILAGKYVSSPVFRYIAETRLREIFTIFALFLVVAIALVMQKLGLSPALGTFLAGVVLAENEFRHELEVDIEPFKGLLLGLFFITVGASIDFPLLFDNLLIVTLLVLTLILIKAVILSVLARGFGLSRQQNWLFSLALAQGGEFAFVLLSLTGSLHILTVEQNKLATLVVAMSMLCAPLMLILYERIVDRNEPGTDGDADTDAIEPAQHVILAGYGRFGQVVGRILSAQGYHLSILDHSPRQIELVARFGFKVYYGDAARQDLLLAAGAENAKLLVIAIDEPDKTLEIIELAQKHFPNLKIAARATDRRHAFELIRRGVQTFRRETFDSAVTLGVDALQLLGNDAEAAARAGAIFSAHDRESLHLHASIWDDDHSYGIAVKQRMADLQAVLKRDQEQQQALKACKGDKDA